jgi:hypothetical protein
MSCGGSGQLLSSWRKPSASAANGNCAEIASTSTQVLVRDTKDHGGPVLTFTPQAWREFAARQKTAG